jgi:para-aminobenzoate synthetase component I
LTTQFSITDTLLLKQKMLSWVKQFNIFCFLDNQQYQVQPHKYECLVAAGAISILNDDFASLDNFIKENKWTFGHLSYELGNRLVGLTSHKKNDIGFPEFFFFKPEVLLFIEDSKLTIEAPDPQRIYQDIINSISDICFHATEINIKSKFSKEEYISAIEKLKHHIHIGDCYEINFCQEFYAENVTIDPVSIYSKLIDISPNPFSALYRINDSYLICASPERFLQKKGEYILSQPMKGTSKRGATTSDDDIIKKELYENEKERAENVMVVDLVRNDLSKICEEGTVVVEELFGIYTFPQVHQMVSTIKGKLMAGVSLSEIFEATFPMGSMTGAPKKRVMHLIEQYEKSSRGIFSGAVGYISPNADFDFNVVIRSIMYNASSKYLSYQVGSGITFYSDPEKEWEECMLKGEAIKKVLTG